MAERRERVVKPLWVLGALIAVLLLAFVLVVGPWLLTQHPQKGLTSEQALKARNDVRTTLVQALAGTAVAGGLAVTYSTYRQNQRDQAARREEQDRAHELSLATHVNDLYNKAVEQLGHKQAPVRLGALYSLVHLAQANPEQRQTVVDVLCAYLRMHYTPPVNQEAGSDWTVLRQEREVRLTAQRLIVDHLRVPTGVSGEDAQGCPPTRESSFWPGISLDLTGALLMDFDFSGTSVAKATFTKATFSGNAYFNKTVFTSLAWFDEVTFTGTAGFEEVNFNHTAWFGKVIFKESATFAEGTFANIAAFANVTFSGTAGFGEASFANRAWFVNTVFTGDAGFDQASFASDARFDQAKFASDARFDQVTFAGETSFFSATFSRHPLFTGSHVLHLDDAARSKEGQPPLLVFPEGWTVQPDANDPTRGTLVSSPKGGGVTP